MLQQITPAQRDELLHEIEAFLGTDLICYRAPKDHPDSTALHAAQALAFDPVLVWLSENYAAAFATTESVMPVAQNAAAIAAAKNEFAAASDAQLLALAELTGLFGSAILTLALWKGHLTLEQALHASRLDEQHAAARYGLDPVIENKWMRQQEKAEKCIFSLTGKPQ